jgi:hypothetical protein
MSIHIAIAGLTDLRKRLAEFMGYVPYCKTKPENQVDWLTPEGERLCCLDWHPDTDIAQAIMVAEQIGKSDGFTLSFTPWHEKPWHCVFYAGSLTGDEAPEAETASMAIAAAADAWLKQEKDNG